MPHVRTDDGVALYYEETGSGEPILFIHEFAGDYRAWEPQMRHFGRSLPLHRLQRPRAIHAVGRARMLPRPLLPGPSPPRRACGAGPSRDRARPRSSGSRWAASRPFTSASITPTVPSRSWLRGAGMGPSATGEELFRCGDGERPRRFIETASVAAFADRYAEGPTRVQFQNKDPRGWAEFREQLAEHSLRGSANTMRGVQSRRPSIYDLEDRMRELRVPTLVLTGDEDDPCLTPNVFMKRTIPSAALVTLPNSGHTINIEEPQLYNQAVDWFLTQVRSGRWPQRDMPGRRPARSSACPTMK